MVLEVRSGDSWVRNVVKGTEGRRVYVGLNNRKKKKRRGSDRQGLVEKECTEGHVQYRRKKF